MCTYWYCTCIPFLADIIDFSSKRIYYNHFAWLVSLLYVINGSYSIL